MKSLQGFSKILRKMLEALLRLFGGPPMSLKGLWRPDWTTGSLQCQGCSRCRIRIQGRGQGSMLAMPRH